jgi:hypothetical protein
MEANLYNIQLTGGISFDDWWVQFEELRKLIDEQYEVYLYK